MCALILEGASNYSDVLPIPVKCYGYFAFLREVQTDIKGESVVLGTREEALIVCESMGAAPSWIVPLCADDRTIVSRVLKTVGSRLRRRRMELRCAEARETFVRHDLLEYTASGVGSIGEMKRVGAVIWETEHGFSFIDGLSIGHPVCVDILTLFESLRGRLSREDWRDAVHSLGFIGRWDGFAAREGGVVYWICPSVRGMLDEIECTREILSRVAGLELVWMPCIDIAVASGTVVDGVTSELAWMNSQPMGPARGRALRLALIEKIGRICLSMHVVAGGPIALLIETLQQEIAALPVYESKDKGRIPRRERAKRGRPFNKAPVVKVAHEEPKPVVAAEALEMVKAELPDIAMPLPVDVPMPMPPEPPLSVEPLLPVVHKLINGLALKPDGKVFQYFIYRIDSEHSDRSCGAFTSEEFTWREHGGIGEYWCKRDGTVYSTIDLLKGDK